jgi:hypothetical protein
MLVTHVVAVDTVYILITKLFSIEQITLLLHMAGVQKLQAPGCHGKSVCMMAPNIC